MGRQPWIVAGKSDGYMKRKIIALCLGVTLALGLAACGNKEEEREAAQKQEQASQDGQSECDATAGQESGAEQEQDENAHPELKNHIEDLGQYDTVILGFPIQGIPFPN